MRDTFLEITKIEPVQGSSAGRYFATFQGRTPEGEFEVTIQFFAAKEDEVFKVARKNMRLMLARLAAVTTDWAAGQVEQEAHPIQPNVSGPAVRGSSSSA